MRMASPCEPSEVGFFRGWGLGSSGARMAGKPTLALCLAGSKSNLRAGVKSPRNPREDRVRRYLEPFSAASFAFWPSLRSRSPRCPWPHLRK